MTKRKAIPVENKATQLRKLGGNPGPHTTKLTIFTRAGDTEVKHKFETNQHVITSGDKFVVTLDDVTENSDKSKIHICGYCSTDTTDGIVEITHIKTKNNPTEKEAKFPYPKDTTEIGFQLNLLKRKMVLIGVLVEITRPGATDSEIYLADPQVGNGPP